MNIKPADLETLKSATMSAILHESQFYQTDNNMIDLAQTIGGINSQYEKMAVPFGQMSLITSNLNNGNTRKLWFGLKLMNYTLSCVTSFEQFETKKNNEIWIREKANDIRRLYNTLKTEINENAGTNAERSLSYAVFDRAITSEMANTIREKSLRIMNKMIDLWNDTVFSDYLQSKHMLMDINRQPDISIIKNPHIVVTPNNSMTKLIHFHTAQTITIALVDGLKYQKTDTQRWFRMTSEWKWANQASLTELRPNMALQIVEPTPKTKTTSTSGERLQNFIDSCLKFKNRGYESDSSDEHEGKNRPNTL